MMERHRTWIAMTALGALAAAEAWTALAWVHSPALQLVLAGFSAALLVAMVGVGYRRMWARWMALGAGLTGVSNLAVFLYSFGFQRGAALEESLLYGIASVVVLLALGGERMATHFSEHLAADSIWRGHGVQTKLLGAAIVTSLSAVAMMLIFGSVVPQVAGEMLVGAFIVIAAAGLTAAGRAIGVVLMGVGAIGASVMAVGLAEVAHGPARCGFGFMLKNSAMFTYPSVALAAVCGALGFAVFARPLLRFVLRPSH
jgi:hypothetical protein